MALPTRPRSRSEARPCTAPANSHAPSAHPPTAVSSRPPHSFSRPQHPKINIDTYTVHKPSMPRRGTGNLALQARDSVKVRKRTMSTGAVSTRVARQNARKASAGLLQVSEPLDLDRSNKYSNLGRKPNSKARNVSPSGSTRGRTRSRSPAGTPSTRTNSHRNRPSRSPSPSSSSPSQSPTPVTPGQPGLSGAPSSYHTRTHVPHNSQETTTSAYPPSSSQSSRSTSSSPERTHLPSPPPRSEKMLGALPHVSSLDLDPDDVNARLRLLVNNSYYLPPAHTKPELSPIYLTPPTSRGATSPSAFKEFFRVGKKKEKKPSEVNGHGSPGGQHGMSPTGAPRTISGGPDRRFGSPRHDLDFQPPVGPARNRVVVVRETLENLPLPAVRAPLRTSSLPTHGRPRTAPEFIDPTTQYDMPPPTHYPSYNNLRLDAAGLTGNVELDQFAPPGEPWSPVPSSPRSPRRTGGGMDPQERVWRRALLEQAVDLSLSSAASDPGHGSYGLQDESFRSLRVNSEENVTTTTSKSPKSKKSWWGKRDKDAEDVPPRPSTSSSNKERPVLHISSQRSTHSLEHPVHPHSAQLFSKRTLGQSIVPNIHAELEQLERQQARMAHERNAGLPPSLRLNVLPFGPTSTSAPVTPLYSHEPPTTPPLPMTPLRPRPAYRRSEIRLDMNSLAERDAREFMPGHSTIRKSLSSPLLSDLHEMGVEVEDPMPFAGSSSDSLNGFAAPSLVLQDPHGVTSLVPSNTADSFTSGSHYSEDDPSHHIFDLMMSPHERTFGLHDDDDDDEASLDRWNRTLSSPDHGGGRPSFDSFGARRVQSPDEDCPARASSTFGFRRSNVSVAHPSPLRGPHRDIEVDISGDPTDHLLLMESQRSSSPGTQSQTSSLRGYVSAVDHTFHGSGVPSQSVHSTNAALTSVHPHPERSRSPEQTETAASISFFDSVQHQSYMDTDGVSSDSDLDGDGDADHAADGPPDVQPTIEYERHAQTRTLGRKSLNTVRPAPAFTTQFRNASQPQIALPRGDTGPPLASMLRPIQPYDHLDRKKPLTNTPLSAPPTSSGILSQLKAKSGKGSLPFPGRGKKSGATLPESTFELLYPHGSALSLGTGVSAGTRSDTGGAGAGHWGFEGVRTQESMQSLRSSAAASISQVASWRQEQGTQDESLRKLDGMLMQHLEAEKDRLRKIATAAREKGRDRLR
ncbi:hypothetical protein JB92DRAFT_3143822 [Gautieria morchelliformis]|nr:hypothetical protein JB92DRAFT_3143822 [Gautieria morchelliformis]